MTASPDGIAGDAHGSYRPDIDGLRAIAVLSVVAYHVQPRRITGGFVGVDVFFVISGFLITGILLGRLQRGRFSIADFYARRVRRIFPTLSIVLLACLATGWFLLLPTEYADLGGNTAGGAGFVSNLLLWRQTNYFGPDASMKPLLHLWSLGIEEQYYAVWPLLLAALWRWRWRLGPILLLLVASLVAGALTSTSDPTAAFYSPLTRMWELLVGSVLAYVLATRGEPVALLAGRIAGSDARRARAVEKGIAEAASIVGLAAVLFAIVVLTDASTFPGWWALLPTLGAALLICAGPGAWINRVLLSNRWMVLVGLISYPLYLWHWPILALIRIQFPDVSYAVKGAAVVATFVLAWLTYRLVETPIRRRGGRRTVTMLATSMALLLAAGLALVQLHGFPNRGDDVRRRIFATDDGKDRFTAAYREGTCFLKPRQTARDYAPECTAVPADAAGRPRVLLWGDSYAAHLLPGIRALGDTSIVLQQLTAGACAPIAGSLGPRRQYCAGMNAHVVDWVRRNPPQTVVLAARWNAYDMYRRVEGTIRDLKALGIPRVVLVGSFPQYTATVPRLLARALDAGAVPQRLHPAQMATLVHTDSVLRAMAARTGAEFVSPLDAECDRGGCLVALDPGARAVTTWDDGHLTLDGSRFVVASLLRPYLAP